MSITAGTYSVGGSGTDYPGTTGLDDAINDITSALTGTLNFIIHDDVTWGVHLTKNFNNKTINITGLTYHNGDLNSGIKVTCNHPASPAIRIYSNPFPGSINIYGLVFTGERIEFGDSGTYGYDMNFNFYKNICTNHDLYFFVNAKGNAYTNKIHETVITTIAGSKTLENNTVYNPTKTGAAGIVCSGNMSTSVFRNNVVITNGASFTASSLTVAPVGYNNYTNDAVWGSWGAGSSGNVGNIVAANEFKSLDDTSSDFLKPLDNNAGLLGDGGVTPTLVSSDIEDNPIPYNGSYPVGAHVSLISRRKRIIMGPF